MTWAAVLFAVVVAVAAFVWSWNALVEVGPWVGLPPSQSWVVPVVLDGAMIVFTLSALVQRARGNSARTEWLSLALFTALSTVFNGMHGWTASAGTEAWQQAAGTVLAAMAPVAVFLSVRNIERLIITDPATAAATEPARSEEPSAPTEVAASSARAAADASSVASPSEGDAFGPVIEAASVLPTQGVAAATSRPSAIVTLPAGPATDKQARRQAVLALREQGLSYAAIAERTGVSKTTVTRIVADAA